MKLRLPTRLVQALLTSCAAALTTNAPVFADVPEDYAPVIITNVDQLADYTKADFIAFIISSDITDSAYRMMGAHQYWTDDVLHTHVLTFEEIESTSNGGVWSISSELIAENLHELSFSQNIASSSSKGGAIYASSSSTVNFTDNDAVSFFGNSTTSSGGAIYASGTLNLTGNESVTFMANTATSSGGAIYASGTFDLTGNTSVTFYDNSTTSSGGGAIYVDRGTLNLTNNHSVFFGSCVCFTEYDGGGAIYGGLQSTINLTNNDSVTFSGCASVTKYDGGGAIYGGLQSTINLTNNDSVTFSGCYCFRGGAIYANSSSTVNFTDNDAVTFSENLADDGGAIYAYTSSTVNFTDNDAVTFSGNHATSSGGAIYASGTFDLTGNTSVTFSENSASLGGAIFSYGCLSLSGNGSVTFRGNSAVTDGYLSETLGFGGAIFASDQLSLIGNETVTFRGNYELRWDSGTYLLRSVCMAGSKLKMAAGEGQNITFYDTLYAAEGAEVSFNAAYQDMEGVAQNAMGDIVFSGKYAAEDLKALKANYTQQELTNSLTTEVYATTNLYGGRMRIEDGAIYKGNGINVAAGSAATLRLADGTLDQAGHDVLLKAGSTLDLAGMNSITADTLDMQDGSTLSFNLGSEEGAILNLNALLQTGELTITISGVLTEERSLVSLYNASLYDTSQWTSSNVTVVGTTFDHLLWDDGVLTYTPGAPQHIVLEDDTEMEDFGDGKRVDIEGNKHSLTVKHPVDLVQLAMKDGVVRLGGADNNVVRIKLTEDGTLELAAGAGLKVGNIVSMVANGSADLVISGDIEISDIKAYGKPGNKGTLSYVNMTTAGDYTIENMTIIGSVIDVGEGTTLYLVNVDIKSDTHITDDPAQVFVQGTHAQLDETNTWVDKEITTAKDTTLYLYGNTSKSITLAAGTDIVALTSDMFDTVTLTGTDLWLDMTGIAEATYNKDYFTLDFKNLAHSLENAQVDVDHLHVYATLDGERYTEAYSTANGGLTTTLYFSVPEPTTSTLSLLALAALAARRRKKDGRA